jgi:hypothetical protein
MSEYQEIHGDTKYRVEFDEIGYQKGDIDFPCEEEELDYMREFEEGYLASYGIITSTFCKCCNQWQDVDSVWGMHYPSPYECLKDFLINYTELHVSQ